MVAITEVKVLWEARTMTNLLTYSVRTLETLIPDVYF